MIRNLTPDQKNTNEIYEWYNEMLDSLQYEENQLISSNLYKPQFLGKTPDEVRRIYLRKKEELDIIACFTLLTKIESQFQNYYRNVLSRKIKNKILRQFFQIINKKTKRPDLIDDIVNQWIKQFPQHNQIIDGLKSIYGFRHWVAHGRYWTQNIGRQIDPIYIHSITDSLETILK